MQALIEGFAGGESLRSVAQIVKKRMRDLEGGNWLCIIKPSGDFGMSFQ